MKCDRLYLEHILEALQRIETYTAGGWADFSSDTMVQDAVLRNFEIIGEATKQLADDTKQRRPDVPWREVAGFRDVLIHNYTGVSLPLVWNVVEQHLPDLRSAIEDLLDL